MLSELIDHGHDVRLISLPKASVPLHCMTVSAGYEQRRNEVYSWDGLQRGTAPFLVLQHTLAGEGRLEFAGNRYRVTPGQTMILTMPHAHRYWLERGGEWEYFWMLINGREALRLAREIIDASGPILTPAAALVDRLAAACLAVLATPDIAPGHSSASGYAAMAALHDAAFGIAKRAPADLPPAITRVIGQIDADLTANLQVERLAAMAELSRSHFVRLFSDAVGVAPSQFVFDRRMERVERLLLATDLSVVAIALATGFADANYLAKAFRRRRGMAPLEYRAEQRLVAGV